MLEAPIAATDEPVQRPPPLTKKPSPAAAASSAAALLSNETVASAGLGWAAAVDDAPVLSLEEPEQAVEQIETFFDDMAFQAAEPQPKGAAPEASSWSVQESSNKSAPSPAAPSDDDDIPVVMGNADLPVVTGQSVPAPSTTKGDPFSGLDWVVGEPGKK